MILEVPYLSAEFNQAGCKATADTRFLFDHGGFYLRRWIVELNRHEALLRALLQILEHTLVPRVIRNHQEEVVGRFENLAFLFNRQEATIVAQGMDDDRRVLPRLDDFVQIDDRAMLHAERQRPINPDRLLALEQIPSHPIGGGEDFRGGPPDPGGT